MSSTSSDRGQIDVVLKRSTDHGLTWSKLRVVHSEYKSNPGTWIGNPAPVFDSDTKTLWLVMCRNNTDVLVTYSKDLGITWSVTVDVSSQVLAPEWRSVPSWRGGWGWVATTSAIQLKASMNAGRLLIVGDVQTAPTENCSSPYELVSSARDQGLFARVGDGRACSQSWVMYSDTHGTTWNYSRTLLMPGNECVAAELTNGSVVINMRGHDLNSYDGGDPNKAVRWVGRSDDGGTIWPEKNIHMLMNHTNLSAPVRFGGDCYATMVAMPQGAHIFNDKEKETTRISPSMLVMGAIYHDGSSGGVIGRSDYRITRSLDGGFSWEEVDKVFSGSASYSGMAALNTTHVGVMINVGVNSRSSMGANGIIKYVEKCVGCKQSSE